MSARCVQCDWLKPTAYLDAVIVGDTIYYVCGPCADNLAGPGKYQAVSADDRTLAVVLEYLASVSGEDEMMTDDYQGYVGIFERHMLIEDDRGFVEVRSFASMDAACKELWSWESDGFGAREDDAWINCGGRGYEVSFDGKYVGTYPRLNRAKAQVALLMRDSGDFPSVWLAGEHGPSVRRVDDIRDLAPLTHKENQR